MSSEWASAATNFEGFGDDAEWWATWYDGKEERRVRMRLRHDDESRCDLDDGTGLHCPLLAGHDGPHVAFTPDIPDFVLAP